MRDSQSTPDKKLLRGFKPLDRLPPTQLDELARRLRIEEVPAGRFIFKRGQRDNDAVFVVSGEVEMLGDDGAVAQTVVGGTKSARAALAPGQPRPLSARAKSRARLFRVDANMLEVLCSDGSGDYEVSELGGGHETDWLTRLLQSGIFARLPAMSIQQMITAMTPVAVEAGQVIIRQGEPPDDFYVIKDGRAVVTRRDTEDGPEVQLAQLEEGTSFGEEALISGGLRGATVTMLSAGTLMRLARLDFDAILREPLRHRVSFDDARQRVAAGAVWLDVRAPAERHAGALDGSVHIPIERLREATPDLDPGKTYIAYAANEATAETAAFLLGQAGRTALVLEGGSGSIPAAQLAPAEETAEETQVRQAGGGEVVSFERARKPDAPDPEALRRKALEQARRQASEEAQKILSQAKEEAEKIKQEARRRERREANKQASQVLEDAKAEAERIKEEARKREQHEENARAELERELASLREELERQRKHAQEARTDAERAIEEAQRSAQQQVESMGAERERLRESLQQAQAQVESLSEQLRAAEAERQEKEQALAHAQSEYATLESELAEARRQTETREAELQQQLEQIQASQTSAREEDQRRQERLQQELEAITNELERERERRAQLQTDKHSLSQSRAEIEARERQLRARLEELEASQHDSQKQDAEHQARLKQDLEEVQSELERERARRAELETQKEELAESRSSSDEHEAELRRQIDEIKASLREAREEDESRQTQLRSELDTVKAELAREREQRAALESRKEALAREKADAEEAMQDANRRIESLRAEALAVREEVESAHEEGEASGEPEGSAEAGESAGDEGEAAEADPSPAGSDSAEPNGSAAEGNEEDADLLRSGYLSSIDVDQLSRLKISDAPSEPAPEPEPEPEPKPESGSTSSGEIPLSGFAEETFDFEIPGGGAPPGEDETLEFGAAPAPEPAAGSEPTPEPAKEPEARERKPERRRGRSRTGPPGHAAQRSQPDSYGPRGTEPSGRASEPEPASRWRSEFTARDPRPETSRRGARAGATPSGGRKRQVRMFVTVVVIAALAAGAYLFGDRLSGWMPADIEATTDALSERTREIAEAVTGDSAPVPDEPVPEPAAKPVQSGDTFRDPLASGGKGPVMVSLPGDRYTMGAPPGQPYPDEQPAHQVLVSELAISRHEVTFEQYDRFAEATGWGRPDDKGWGRGARPVINVSWSDAAAFTQWLSEQTGQRYRLPTEAEWEYAARAGTRGFYWWGSRLGSGHAHCLNCGSEHAGERTQVVGQLPPNPFGLHNTAGNVREWVRDCYRAGYDKAPPAAHSGCARHVVRGGDFTTPGSGLRSSARAGLDTETRQPTVGFRVVREG